MQISVNVSDVRNIDNFLNSYSFILHCFFLGFQQNNYIVGFLSKPQSEGTTEEKCAVHKQTVILFCTQCRQLLCTTCLVKQHNGHKVKVTEVYTLVLLTTSKKIKKDVAMNYFSAKKCARVNLVLVLTKLVVSVNLKLNEDNTY